MTKTLYMKSEVQTTVKTKENQDNIGSDAVQFPKELVNFLKHFLLYAPGRFCHVINAHNAEDCLHKIGLSLIILNFQLR